MATPTPNPGMFKNVQISETETDLIIRISKAGDFGLSTTGKTTIVASTGGFRPPTPSTTSGLRLNIMVIK